MKMTITTNELYNEYDVWYMIYENIHDNFIHLLYINDQSWYSLD